jgi:hypothetical protein
MDTVDITLEVELDGRKESIEVTAVFEYEGCFNGIGHFECHGQKGFHKGAWQVENIWFKDFQTDETLTAAEKKQIEIFCENYAESGKVEEKIYNQEI